MIRLGERPTLRFVEGHNDMSHWVYSSWEVTGGFFYVTDEMFMRLRGFCDPELYNAPTDSSFDLASLLKTPFAERVKNAIALNPNGSQLWEFDGLVNLTTDMDGDQIYVRKVAFFGKPTFIVPTRFDLALYPILLLAAKILNKTLYFKHKKEKTFWDRILTEAPKGPRIEAKDPAT